MGIGAQSGGRLSDRYGPRRFMIFGFLVAILSGMVMASFNRESSLPLIVAALFVNGTRGVGHCGLRDKFAELEGASLR